MALESKPRIRYGEGEVLYIFKPSSQSHHAVVEQKSEQMPYGTLPRMI